MIQSANLAVTPSEGETLRALLLLAHELDVSRCYLYRGAVHFSLGHPYTLAIRPESGGRFRVEACVGGERVDSLWTLADDQARLVELARELSALVTPTRDGDRVVQTGRPIRRN